MNVGEQAKAMLEGLRPFLEPKQGLSLILVEDTSELQGEVGLPEGAVVSYASTINRNSSAAILLKLVESWLSQRPEGERWGSVFQGVSDAMKIATMEVVQRAGQFLQKEAGMPEAAFEAMLLVYAVNAAHERNVARDEILAACLGTVDEEYSTPNTAGRQAVAGALAGMSKSKGCRCAQCGAEPGQEHRSVLCR